jgi:hypothetical protein
MTRPAPKFAELLSFKVARLYGAGEQAMIQAAEAVSRTARTLYRWTKGETEPEKEVQVAVLAKLELLLDARKRAAKKERPLQEGEGK